MELGQGTHGKGAQLGADELGPGKLGPGKLRSSRSDQPASHRTHHGCGRQEQERAAGLSLVSHGKCMLDGDPSNQLQRVSAVCFMYVYDIGLTQPHPMSID